MKFNKLIIIVFLTFVYSGLSQTVNEIKMLLDNGRFIEAKELVSKINNETENIDLLILKGDVYFELEEIEEAKKAYEAAYDLDDNPETIAKYGMILSVTEDYKKSEKVLEEGIDDYEENIPIRLELASNYIRAGKLTDAEVQIKRAKDIDEDDARIYITEGDMYFNQRVYELSKNSYVKALELDENQTEARSKLATSYYWLANYSADRDLSNEYFTLSLQEWDKVTQQDSMDAKAFFNKGKILFLAKKEDKAISALYRYYQLRPDGALGRWYLSQSLYKLNLCDSASSHLEYVSNNIDSVSYKAKLMMARCYYNSKDYANASTTYKPLLEEGKDNPEIERADFRRYGTSLLFTGDTTTALVIYKDLINEYPETSCALSNLVGRLMFSAKKYDEAIYFFDKRLEPESCSDSTDAKILYYKGLSYLFLKQIDSAIVTLEKAFNMDSTDAAPLAYLGDAYASTEDDEKAIEYFEKAIETSLAYPVINKNNIRSSYGKLCGLYYKQKDWNKLLSVAKSWTENQPKSEYGPLYVAIAYQGLQDIPNACKWYGKVLEINPNNKGAAQNRSALGCN